MDKGYRIPSSNRLGFCRYIVMNVPILTLNLFATILNEEPNYIECLQDSKIMDLVPDSNICIDRHDANW